MQIPKVQKIDQQQTYPCPCRKKAKLKPIALMDAFGCDRCCLMFTIEDSGYSLVQVGGLDPYRRAWQWIGSKWQLNRNLAPKYSVEFIPIQLLLVSTALLLVMLLLTLNLELSLGLPIAIFAATPLVLAIIWWIILHRRDS